MYITLSHEKSIFLLTIHIIKINLKFQIGYFILFTVLYHHIGLYKIFTIYSEFHKGQNFIACSFISICNATFAYSVTYLSRLTLATSHKR